MTGLGRGAVITIAVSPRVAMALTLVSTVREAPYTALVGDGQYPTQLPKGGFPMFCLYDRPGISVMGSLDPTSDDWIAGAFWINVGFYTTVILVAFAVASLARASVSRRR